MFPMIHIRRCGLGTCRNLSTKPWTFRQPQRSFTSSLRRWNSTTNVPPEIKTEPKSLEGFGVPSFADKVSRPSIRNQVLVRLHPPFYISIPLIVFASSSFSDPVSYSPMLDFERI